MKRSTLLKEFRLMVSDYKQERAELLANQRYIEAWWLGDAIYKINYIINKNRKTEAK